MKVILKSKIKKLGNIGDIVDVKDGYAKNMLIPNGLAVFYTDKNYEVFKLKKDEIEKQNEENKSKAEELKSKIENKDLVLIENAGDDGKLYGSISGIKLAKFINQLFKIDTLKKSNISLKEPIKTIGKFTIILDLHPEVSFEKDLVIARSKEEAIKIKKGEFKLEKKENNNSEIEEQAVFKKATKKESANTETILENKVEDIKAE